MARTIDVAELPSVLANEPDAHNETMVLRKGGAEVGLFVPFVDAEDNGQAKASAARIDAEVVAEMRRRRALSDLRSLRREVAAENPAVTEEQAMEDALAAIEDVRAEKRAGQR